MNDVKDWVGVKSFNTIRGLIRSNNLLKSLFIFDYKTFEDFPKVKDMALKIIDNFTKI